MIRRFTLPILALSKMTFLESVREKVFTVLIFFAAGLYGVSVALGNLSFAEQGRITASFGLAAAHIVSMVIATYLGIAVYNRDFDRKTIHLLLAKPVSRLQYLLGRFLGFSAVMLTFALGLSAMLLMMALIAAPQAKFIILAPMTFVFLESLVVLSVGLFCVSWSRPVLALFLTISTFLVGHWLDSLRFFSERAQEGSLLKVVGGFVAAVWPDLEKFNMRSVVFQKELWDWQASMLAAFYGWILISVFLTAGYLVLQRRELD